MQPKRFQIFFQLEFYSKFLFIQTEKFPFIVKNAQNMIFLKAQC